MRPKLYLVSLGCSKNLVDSEVMLGKLAHYELIGDIGQADVILVNTCGFISSAKQESVRVLLEAIKARKKGALVVASGCLSQRYQKELQEQLPQIDIFTGVGDYDRIDALIQSKQSAFSQRVFLADASSVRTITGSQVHAYVKLSEGCNQSCSFCAIPSFKGRLQSKSITNILKEVENLARQGFSDISFVAQDSSSYLSDQHTKNGLVELIKAIDQQHAIKSARIFYLYPASTTPELIETIATSSTFVNYFDMPIQHISDRMLKTMRRNSDSKMQVALLEQMKAVPDSFLRTTLLLGHPGESEQDIAALQEFLEDFSFDRINLFAFSPEENTRAYQMDLVPDAIVNARLNALSVAVNKQVEDSMQSLLNKPIEVIVEGMSADGLFLRARDKRWGLEIDGEILINESLVENVKHGHYQAICHTYEEGILLGKIIA